MSPPPDATKLFVSALGGTQHMTYAQRRERLLAEESESNWDWRVRKNASQVEKDAAALVARIRDDERCHLFGNVPGETIPGPEVRDMGGQFLVNMSRIQQSDIFHIAKAMPKACHLHIHFNAELPPELLIIQARQIPKTMFIRSTKPLVDELDFETAEIVFSVLPEDSKSVDIFQPDYRPDWKTTDSRPWMRWQDFQRAFPSKIMADNEDHLSPAEQWARDKIVLSNMDVYGYGQTCNGIWARFNQSTRAFKGLLNYKSAYRWYVERAIDTMVEDGVFYVEWRPMLLDKKIPSDDGQRHLTNTEQFAIIAEIVKRKRIELGDRFLGARIIYCTPRSIPRTQMQLELLDCIHLKQQFPDLVCGFDLVGAEDRPNSIGFYSDLLITFQETCSKLGLDIPFLFHAGETLLDTGGSSSPQMSNLYDALLLSSKRISHGVALLEHPVLIEKLKTQEACIELCPISNELLHLCSNVKQHPYIALLASGLECCVNADNPSLFRGTALELSALSYEFYQIMVGSPKMSLHGWRQLAEWSIKHSCMTGQEKLKAYDVFKRQWQEFCAFIVEQYADRVKSLPKVA